MTWYQKLMLTIAIICVFVLLLDLTILLTVLVYRGLGGGV